VVLDQHRDRLDWWLVPLARSLRHVNPNTITWISLVAALTGGIAFWQSGPDRLWPLAIAAAMVITNGILDVLDGKVATMTGRATPKGDYLDHAIDRFADVAFIGGIAFSGFGRVEVGLAALAFTLLTSYLGTQAQAIGMPRNYAGLLGRADRMVLMMTVPWLQLLWVIMDLPWPDTLAAYTPSLLDAMLLYFAIVGAITTVQRFVSGLRGFGPDGQVK
jgi:archaetidylinositol phosphate synthase